MPFSEILGQNDAIRHLKGFFRTGRLPHALLFLGPEGTGRRLAATRLFQAFACEERRAGREPSDDACGRCNACHRVALHVAGPETQGSYPDLHLLEPGAKGTIDNIRSIIRSLSMRSFAGGAKGLILDPADDMRAEHANVLLKTIEEPPDDTLIVLIGTYRTQILPTILSRCIPVRFRPLADEIIVRRLQEAPPKDTTVTPEQARWAAALAQGSLGQAIKALGGEFADLEALARDAVTEELTGKSDPGDWSGRLAAQFKGNRSALPDWLDLMILIHRSALGAVTSALPGSLGSDAGRLRETLDPDDLARRIDGLLQIRRAIDRYAHLEISLDKLIMDLRSP